MDCGTSDTVCQVMFWVTENELATGLVAKLAGQLGVTANGFVGAIGALLAAHGEKLIGIGGFVFGIWRAWKYREQILHKRLQEYLRENDKRLVGGQTYVLEAMQRPGPGQTFQDPLFIGSALRSVLRERNWDRSPVAATVERSADLQLASARSSIERRIEAADATITSLRRELATTHILRGAVAASSAKRVPSRANERNNAALSFFRSVLQIPGQQQNLLAKEFEAHQLRKLGYSDQALETYIELERLAATIADHRSQRLAIASARRYRAEILQWQSSIPVDAGKRSFAGAATANSLLSPLVAESALSIRSPFAPFQNWQLLEQAQIEYLAAFVAKNLRFQIQEAYRLDEAMTSYDGVISGCSGRKLWRPRAEKQLLALARAGKERVLKAQRGEYDVAWLAPSD